MKQSTIIHSPHDIWPPREWLNQMGDSIHKYLYDGNLLSIKDGTGVIEELENCYKAYFDVPYALATNSGTAAVHSALIAIGVNPGDEIISQTSTFHAAITPVIQCGGIPILCETDGISGNLDVEDFVNKISPRTKAVVVTHMWGYPADMLKIVKIAKAHGIYIIEDCSHAHGTIYQGKKVGTWGDVATFSMQESKLIPAGEGGMLITSNPEIYERAVLLGQFGERAKKSIKNEQLSPYWETGLGLKYRIHPLAAICAIVSFSRFEKYLDIRRRRIRTLASYLQQIPYFDILIEASEEDRYSYFMNRVRYLPRENQNRPVEDVIQRLASVNLEVRRASAQPLHYLSLFQQPPEQYILNAKLWNRYGPGDFPVTEQYFKLLVGFPRFDHPDGDELVEYYGNTIMNNL
ncbi:DegT/DnrJ/EryC1/StrS family aminotransferase [Cohnella algarum]|uniref:DegT/DnrJ/EryC1/StrS aminotransferase family protein n=1 Tax=Cohnella algarum TaxID=2044859 RepID=UPI0019683C30|nr:DegT/DnrJ/EryC1/StrS family aminotransferase [Cohnella algarum]MBN2984752.1 DegT/DnrJ/EryC1/StrS family aminotransferase [Cohnella algarum]